MPPLAAIRWGALTLGVAALVATWAAVVSTLLQAQPVHASQPNSIVWNDRVFSSRSSLEGWLRSRGADYHAWVERHRALAAIIDPSVTPAPAASQPPAAAARPRHRSLHALWLVLVLAGAAAAAALGRSLLLRRRTLPRRPALPSLRVTAPRHDGLLPRGRAFAGAELRAAVRDNGLALLIGGAIVVGVGILIGTGS